MLLTDVWELFDYWESYPPVHVILRARYISSDPPKSRDGMGGMNDAERLIMASSPVSSFDKLPLHVQAALAKGNALHG